MTPEKQNPPIDFSEADKPPTAIEKETGEDPKKDVRDPNLPYSRSKEEEVADHQTLTAFVPGGGMAPDSQREYENEE
ncbi:MAG: hypothetical protein SAL07_06215 [Oscillatoria sp. PMC 1051.18]|nr:hypothetical protein [Oscillatoria sp. PMC 1050.18]MEC5029489.1 hypothetical protein [Oscillatoria sp. PMC 1051.18]